MSTTPRRCAGRREISRPSRRIRPAVGDSRPAKQRRRVDFPLPFGPSRTNNSPGSTSNVRWCSTASLPQAAESPSTRRIGSELDTATSEGEDEEDRETEEDQESGGRIGNGELSGIDEAVQRDGQRRVSRRDEEVGRGEFAQPEG